jgi:Fe2+ transport system protein FeoA
MGNLSGSQKSPSPCGEYEIQKTTLSDLTAGKAGIVSHLEGDKEFMNRLATLGFTIGAQVTVMQNHGQGPMIVSMLGAHIALGRHEANLIQVQRL